MDSDKTIKEIYGNTAWLCGGAVRDALIGVEPKDRDYIVLDKPTEIASKAINFGARVQHDIVAGKKVGFRLSGKGLPSGGVTVCPPRAEASTGPGHGDFDVKYIEPVSWYIDGPLSALHRDSMRRDYAINAAYLHLATESLFDPHGASFDINNKVLRMITDRAFQEDALRILRGAALVGRFGFTVDTWTQEHMEKYSKYIDYISNERIGIEMSKLILGKYPEEGIELIHEIGGLGYVIPELDMYMDYDQDNPHHDELLGDHLLEALHWASMLHREDRQSALELRWAALLHDIGKPDARWEDEKGVAHYYGIKDKIGHEELGAALSTWILEDLRYDKQTIRNVYDLILHHMINPSPRRASEGRRLRQKVGNDAILPNLIALRFCDFMAKKNREWKHNLADSINDLDKLRVRVQKAMDEICHISELPVNGNDLIALGYPRSPVIRVALNRILNDVIGSPENKDRDWCIRAAGRLKKELL